MTTIPATHEFLDLLVRSGVVERDNLDDAVWRYSLRDESSPITVARKLIKQGVVTRFQAERVLNRRWRGLVIGGYKLLNVLGAGGMGWVYAAQEPNSSWTVAIKLISNERRKDQGMLARMQLEAQAGLRLQHPNILRTLAFNRAEDQFGTFSYVVMELVQGITPLEMLCLHKKIAWQQACDMILQTAQGLHYAHQAGLVHRDVKPENLLIRSNGAVKILDFGLAMLDEDDEEFSMAMIFGQDRVGTADYVAPEQTINSYHVDHRADIYSLGCTFYFLLTGKVPFPYSNPARKLLGHRCKKPLAIEQFRSDVPAEVIAIVNKMMAKRADKRFATAAEVATLLEPYAERLPVSFDFEFVRRARVKQAERRLAAKQRKLSSSSVSSAAGASAAAPTPSEQAHLETKVRHETRTDHEDVPHDDLPHHDARPGGPTENGQDS